MYCSCQQSYSSSSFSCKFPLLFVYCGEIRTRPLYLPSWLVMPLEVGLNLQHTWGPKWSSSCCFNNGWQPYMLCKIKTGSHVALWIAPYEHISTNLAISGFSLISMSTFIHM